MTVLYNQLARVIARGSNYGQRFENVYWYRNDDIITTWEPQQLAETFLAEVIIPVRNCQFTSLSYDSVTVENLDGDRSFFELSVDPVVYHGILTGGDGASPLLAMGIKLTVGSRIVRPGHKRLGGVSESMMAAGGGLTSGQLGLLAAAADAIVTVLSPVTLGNATPVIVGFPHPAGEHSAARPDRVEAIITGYTLQTNVTTQNSRKIGHGT